MIVSGAVLALIAACSGEQNQQTSTDTDSSSVAAVERPSPVQQTIPTTDELGTFDTPVSGLTVWEHPDVIFESLVLAANGAAGIIAVNFEQEAVASLPGTFETGLALSYLPDGQTSAGIIAAYDESAGMLRFVDLEAGPVSFVEWDITGETEQLATLRPLCFGKSANNDRLSLFAIDAAGDLSRSFVSLNGKALQITPATSLGRSDVTTCASNDVTGETYFLRANGSVEVANAFAETVSFEPFTDLPGGEAVELATALRAENVGYLLAMVSSEIASGPYVIYAYALSEAQAVGQFTLGEFSEITAVETISAFTADASNFGGLYREGAIAIVEGNDTFTLKLASWSAVSNILDLQQTDRLDRRDIGVRPASEDGEELLLQLPELVSEPPVQ
ncbi:MAG: hypothetical protein MRY59_11670 [Aquisalinus sp.]|nr:hypothetical protein [Aquisalinus sp.]